MKPLDKSLRSQLEKTVREARDVSETAARIALNQLGVAEAAPFSYQSESERELRRKLRVHGRQLGDALNGGQQQSMDRLIEEVAYEHWHRMLFARFLVENNLLMYPDPVNPVPITLDECQDLAAKEGAKNGWELAARFAAHMLPQIFRLNSPVFQLCLPPEHQQRLEKLIDELPIEVFKASDSLGWVYQFWQAKRKDEVNASEVKIGARELPAVTQLFTEPYMVSFLLDNSLGAWWATRRLRNEKTHVFHNEEEVRGKVSLPNLTLEYLRFVNKAELWSPAAGSFDYWPEKLRDLKVLDPCCGSGHFLVAAFLMLVPMRMEMEKLSPESAVNAVLQENLHGLEIDQRCVELAAFALAMAAWRYPGAGGYRKLPDLNIACSGLAISAKRDDWLAIAHDKANLQYVLSQLYRQFMDAPILGSLINPEIGLGKSSLIGMPWEEVAPILSQALQSEKDYEKSEMSVVAQGIAKSAQILSSKYHLIITNVPYLGRGKQSELLSEFCKEYYPESKNDLATVFLERCLELCTETGTTGIVLPHNWLFLTSYARLRKKLLTNDSLQLIARLGPGAFETISGEVVKAILIILSKGLTKEGIKRLIYGIDVSKLNTAIEKAYALCTEEINQIEQSKQLKNPDFRLSFDLNDSTMPLLKEYAECYQGLRTGDRNRFVHFFWECLGFTNGWVPFQDSNESFDQHYDGLYEVLFWQNGRGQLHQSAKERIKHIAGMHESGNRAWGKKGVAINLMYNLGTSLYMGTKFDGNLNVLFPKNPEDLPAIWTYCSSQNYKILVRQIDQKLSVTNATLLKVPFDFKHWTKIAREKYPNGIPKPYSNDPTQWIFHGHPAYSTSPLQVAVARLLGYQWPAELDKSVEISEDTRTLISKSRALLPYSDTDGIVCIPSVRGEMRAEDGLENLLAASYGKDWSSSKRSELLAQADYSGKSLESWLREKFFAQHCTIFHERPFIWHIWDGLSDGFAALVNYHMLDAKLLETLIYTYLGDWINQQKQNRLQGVDGSEEKLAAAEMLKKRLELILEGEKPYDIFVRWKTIEQQPVGWNPDLNDGVRVNIRPFVSVPDVAKKGAGILREKPKISWGVDRGRDMESAPWFKIGPTYNGNEGDRVNDHHLSIAEKKASKKK